MTGSNFSLHLPRARTPNNREGGEEDIIKVKRSSSIPLGEKEAPELHISVQKMPGLGFLVRSGNKG